MKDHLPLERVEGAAADLVEAPAGQQQERQVLRRARRRRGQVELQVRGQSREPELDLEVLHPVEHPGVGQDLDPRVGHGLTQELELERLQRVAALAEDDIAHGHVPHPAREQRRGQGPGHPDVGLEGEVGHVVADHDRLDRGRRDVQLEVAGRRRRRLGFGQERQARDPEKLGAREDVFAERPLEDPQVAGQEPRSPVALEPGLAVRQRDQPGRVVHPEPFEPGLERRPDSARPLAEVDASGELEQAAVGLALAVRDEDGAVAELEPQGEVAQHEREVPRLEEPGDEAALAPDDGRTHRPVDGNVELQPAADGAVDEPRRDDRRVEVERSPDLELGLCGEVADQARDLEAGIASGEVEALELEDAVAEGEADRFPAFEGRQVSGEGQPPDLALDRQGGRAGRVARGPNAEVGLAAGIRRQRGAGQGGQAADVQAFEGQREGRVRELFEGHEELSLGGQRDGGRGERAGVGGRPGWACLAGEEIFDDEPLGPNRAFERVGRSERELGFDDQRRRGIGGICGAGRAAGRELGAGQGPVGFRGKREDRGEGSGEADVPPVEPDGEGGPLERTVPFGLERDAAGGRGARKEGGQESEVEIGGRGRGIENEAG